MSLQTALTGLNGAQTGLNTVSNDLANADTTAFKSQTAEFADVYPLGSSNVPGLGVTNSAMDTDFSQGATTSTGNPLDAAIQGNGYFIVSQNGTQEYTRAGSFTVNPAGQLVTASTGATVMGLGSSGALGPITVKTGAMSAKASSASNLQFDLSSTPTIPTVTTFSPNTSSSYTESYPVTVYDSLGNADTVDLYFVPTAGSASAPASYTIYAKPVPSGSASSASAYVSSSGSAAGYKKLGTLAFNSSGTLVSGSPATLNVNWNNGAATSTVAFNFAGTTLGAQSFAVAANNTNGYAPGNYSGTTISSTGELISTYSNGQTQPDGTLAIANFINQEGLNPLSGNLYAATTTSGQPVIDTPGTGQAGTVSGGELEQSNASTSALLVSLIQYQQAYQANASVIQTEQTDSTRLTQI